MRFKILVFVIALALLGGTFLAAYWFYDTIDRPERRAEDELKRRVREVATLPAPDPAATSFQKALDALTAGEIDSTHDQLTRLMKVYPSSPRLPEVRRILGEINLDRLFSRSPMPGKRDYIVKPGDSLARIEKGSLTTIPFLKQLNNLTGLNLQPGDRLVYQPLEFEVEIDLGTSMLIVRQKAAAGLDPVFFKEYPLTGASLPPNLPKTFKTIKTQIHEKVAWYDGRKLLPSDPKYSFARKRFVTTGTPSRISPMLRPEIDRLDPPQPPPEPARAAAAPAPGAAASGTAAPAPREAAPAAIHGIFLADADMEELSTILRVGTPVIIHR